ncbi:MAG: FtsW/RodA/SpoVE family cell cycle protein [Candidatus Paceibacterota bacterium]
MVLSRLFSFKEIRKRAGSPDYVMLVSFIFILGFGLLMLSSASADLGKIREGDTYFYLKSQLTKGVGLGLLAFLFLYFIDYKYLKKFSIFLLLLSIILLILVFTPLGETKKGATRWLDIGPASIQPAEIVKFTFLIYVASWLSGKKGERRRENLKEGFLPFILISGIIATLLFLQPATSIVAIIMLSALIVYYIAGGKKSFVFWLVLVITLAISVYAFFTPYRWARISSFFDFIKTGEVTDTTGAQHQLNQNLITIGSGGIFGVGYGNSVNKKSYLPEPIGDSIFSVIAEEFGFVGATILILIFFILVLRGFILAYRTEDTFARLVLVGFSSVIGIQVFTHVATNSGLIPTTGIPLPFVSFGSTSMAVFLAMAGVMLNMSKYAK